jgi:hypothetical protein
MDYKKAFEKKKLLTSGEGNTKTAKNKRSTYYLSLQPVNANSKRINLCKFSTKECRDQCLQYAGRQGFTNVVMSRISKTEFLVNDNQAFVEKLWNELQDLNKSGKEIAVRLNILSDVDWEYYFETYGYSLESLNNIQFYDYTKDYIKLEYRNKPKNYHFTYSFSGYNWDKCRKFLDSGINVAMVFKNALPLTYQGYKVINGDLSDERYLDEKGVIVGLRYKVPRGKKYEKNKFVIE